MQVIENDKLSFEKQ